jgi:predicted ATPase/DNA-binding winged helix-turn-helix (wHTH) protein
LGSEPLTNQGASGVPIDDVVRIGAVEVRTAQRQVLVDGRPAAIGARAFDVLLMLLEHRDRVVTKDELIARVWAGLVVEENNLQVQISALRRLLGAGAIATVPARGYRFVATADPGSASVASAAAAAASARGLALGLPNLRTHFFGRAREKRQALAHLRHGALLTLIGIGGSGKTRLALEVARDAQTAHPDGVAFVDLAAVGDAQDVGAMVANALGIREVAGTPVVRLLQERLRTSRLLLVLDNCEHLLEPVATLVDALLGHCGELRVMVTSREALGIAGEQVQPVGALELANADDVAALRDCDAARLFADRARLVAPDFQVDAGNAAALHEVCRRLDGIPLALELAAARLNVLSVEQLRARLDDRFRLLSGGRRALPRQQTLDAVVRWSYEHLNAAEQRLLQRLSVFSGGSTIEAAVSVSAPEASEHEVIEQLSSLAAKSLIGLASDAREPRHPMLETVRLYALERLDGDGRAGEARDRHLAFFAKRAEELIAHSDPRVRENADAVLDADRDNLIAALRYGAHGGAPIQTWRLARALEGYWETFGLCELGHSLIEAMWAATAPGLDGVTRAMALRATRESALETGRYPRVMQLAEEHLQLARALGDQGEEFNALRGIAVAALALNDAPRAWSQVESMEALCAGRPERARTARHFRAEILRSLGRLDEAELLFRQNLDEAIASGRQGSIVNGAVALALIALARPELASARRWTERAIDVRARSDQGLYGIAHILLIAAALHAADRDWDMAARLHGAADAHLQHTGQRIEPIDMAPLEPFLSQARTALPPDAYAKAFDAGRALSQQSIVSLAAHCLAPSPAP